MILFRSETPLARGLAPIHTANAALAPLKCEPETHFVLVLRTHPARSVVLVLRTQAV